jgi:hypothetical protein
VAWWWLRNDRQPRVGSSCTVTLVSLCGHDRRFVRRRQTGWTLAEIARQLNVSRATGSKWWHRLLADPNGDWFKDRSSRPRTCPHQTPAEAEAAIVRLRHQEKLGPARIGYRLDMPASTLWKLLRGRSFQGSCIGSVNLVPGRTRVRVRGAAHRRRFWAAVRSLIRLSR